jgi:hypothetical protein
VEIFHIGDEVFGSGVVGGVLVNMIERKERVIVTEGFDFFGKLRIFSARENGGRGRVRGMGEKFKVEGLFGVLNVEVIGCVSDAVLKRAVFGVDGAREEVERGQGNKVVGEEALVVDYRGVEKRIRKNVAKVGPKSGGVDFDGLGYGSEEAVGVGGVRWRRS